MKYMEVCKEVHTLYYKFFLKKNLFWHYFSFTFNFYEWEIHMKLQSSIKIPGALRQFSSMVTPSMTINNLNLGTDIGRYLHRSLPLHHMCSFI